jgi:hypothetical protein
VPEGPYEIPIESLWNPYIAIISSISLLYDTLTIFSGPATASSRVHLRCVMLFNLKHDDRLAQLEEKLRCAETITSKLMSDVMVVACVRSGAPGAATKGKIDLLINVSAWTDATLALLKLELPQWKLRRLVYEDGEWLCSLSRQSGLPLDYDQVAEANHESLPLAILIAILQARRVVAVRITKATAVPQVRFASGYTVCCEVPSDFHEKAEAHSPASAQFASSAFPVPAPTCSFEHIRDPRHPRLWNGIHRPYDLVGALLRDHWGNAPGGDLRSGIDALG